MENSLDIIVDIIKEVGFPCFCAWYLLVYVRKAVEDQKAACDQLLRELEGMMCKKDKPKEAE